MFQKTDDIKSIVYFWLDGFDLGVQAFRDRASLNV